MLCRLTHGLGLLFLFQPLSTEANRRQCTAEPCLPLCSERECGKTGRKLLPLVQWAPVPCARLPHALKLGDSVGGPVQLTYPDGLCTASGARRASESADRFRFAVARGAEGRVAATGRAAALSQQAALHARAPPADGAGAEPELRKLRDAAERTAAERPTREASGTSRAARASSRASSSQEIFCFFHVFSWFSTCFHAFSLVSKTFKA